MTNATRQPIAKLVPPHMDKHWSFQVANRKPHHEQRVRECMATPEVKAASPFLQGLSSDWLMVEFWERDEAVIKAAVEKLAQAVKLPVVEGNFTREELGL